MRVAGVNIPDGKRIDIALTYIYGIGRSNVIAVLEKAQINPSTRTNVLTEEEITRIQKALDVIKIEGDLRGEIFEDIKRLKNISSYRGLRHARSLPVRGQRTRSNAHLLS